MLKSSFPVAVAFAASFVSLASARAQDPAAAPGAAAQRPKWVVACEEDMKKHCKQEVDAKADVRPCLAKHENELSEACETTFLRQYKVLELCKEDIEKLCKDAASGGQLGKCFMDNKDKLSDKCRGALSKGSKEHQKAAAEEKKAAAATPAAAKTEAPAKDDKKAAKGKKTKAKKEKK